MDTAGWYAYIRRDDPHHLAVARVLEDWEGRLVTSNYIFDESVTLIRSRMGHTLAVRVGEALRSGGMAEMARARLEDEDAAWKMFRSYQDKNFSFTDCVSFALMSRLGIDTAVTTDAHFAQAGFSVLPPR